MASNTHVIMNGKNNKNYKKISKNDLKKTHKNGTKKN